MLDDLKGFYTEFNLLDSHPIGKFKEHLGFKTNYRKLPKSSSIVETCIPKIIAVLIIILCILTICFTHGPSYILFLVIWYLLCAIGDMFVEMCCRLFLPQFIFLSILVLFITVIYFLSCSFFFFTFICTMIK